MSKNLAKSIRVKYLGLLKRYLPNFFGSDEMIEWLRYHGVSVGEYTKFYNPHSITIDVSRPCLLDIGAYCKITSGVTILTHDYSRSVLRITHGELLGEGKKTVIGNNVFVGINSLVLMGAKIGNNVIVGAGSVVSGTFPDNVVIAGNPATIIRTIDEHYDLRKKRSIEEAKAYVGDFYKYYGRLPTSREMSPFSWLFVERSIEAVEAHGLSFEMGGDDPLAVEAAFMMSKPVFKSYEEFLELALLDLSIIPK